MLNTKCEKCIFVQTNDGKQTGCKFDIPSTIVDNYPSVYPKDTTISVQSNGFWKLMKFVCPVALTETGKQYLIDNGTDPGQVGDTILSLTKNPYYLIYFLDDNIKSLESNLKQLLSNFCQPAYISFVKRTKIHSAKTIIDILNTHKLPQWKLHDIVDTTRPDNEIVDMILDTNLGANDSRLLSIWYNKYMMPIDYYDKVNESMNYFLHKKAYFDRINDEDFNGLFIPFSSYVNHHKKINFTMQSLNEDMDAHKLYVI